MKTIRTQFRFAFDFILSELSIFFLLAVGSFILLTIFTTNLFSQNPEMGQKLMSSVVDKFQGIIQNGEISFRSLLINNVQASIMGILAGLIPFLFLPVLGIFTNAAILGLVFSSTKVALVPLWKVILVGILPHGIFELTAFFLCYAMGISICWNLTQKIIGDRRRDNLKTLIQNCFRVTIFFVVPLLIVAALIETYVTGQLVSTFL